MANILIKGIEMPKDKLLTITITPDGKVFRAFIPGSCGEVISLPEGYGRLIDADALIRDKSGEVTLWCGYEYQDHSVVFEEDIKNAPTIIPAEGDKAV